MRTTQQLILAGLGVVCFGFGLLGGILVERVRFDQRRIAVLRPYEERLRERNETLMTVELAQKRAAGEANDAPESRFVRRVDTALDMGNVSAAVAAWRDAYAEAIGSRRWEGLIDVGDAALRIGAVAPPRQPYEAKARSAYQTAFFRARQQGSLDGVLRTARAFAALGDRAVVAQCLHEAWNVAGVDAKNQDRVRAFAEEAALPMPAPEPANPVETTVVASPRLEP